jgi:ATP-dependent DNA helicase DinG
MTIRATEAAADALRRAIREAGGVEVFAIGDVQDGVITDVTVTCRGREDRVNALLDRPQSGQVVIHNHPSGDLRPSGADMQLAGAYGENGVGFVIVDSEVGRDNWVVEPYKKVIHVVSDEEVEAFFDEALPRVVPGWETRTPQRRMALAVNRFLQDNTPLICEAGTGTGKSLAYLVPAAMWAMKNEAKVVVSTHTRALQAQLLASDLRLLSSAGLEVRAKVLEGRGNYLCKRRLELARDDQSSFEGEAKDAFEDLLAWSGVTQTGSRSDFPHSLPPSVWDRVSSDTDLSLKTKCSFYGSCHFYQARREAAQAHLVVVNHSLLLMDLHLRAEIGRGILPKYDRVILDEAQHLEDVATQVGSARVTALAVRRALRPLLSGRHGPGALGRLAKQVASHRDAPASVAERVARVAADVAPELETLSKAAEHVFDGLVEVMDPSSPARRVDDAWRADPEWSASVKPPLAHLAQNIEAGAAQLETALQPLDDHPLPEREAQSVLDVRRAIRRLTGHAATIRTFLEADDPDQCRWLETVRRRGKSPSAAVCAASIDVAPTLARLLWQVLPGTVATSATLSVDGDFTFWKHRVGLYKAEEMVVPSPFSYFDQCLLGLPRDLPPPGAPRYDHASADAVVASVLTSRGGAFVLCTSYRAVQLYATALRSTVPRTTLVLAQGDAPRGLLLERFRKHRNAVLVGTDSFWEGVSVKGDALRLVVIPRLPFRVPTDPLQLARYERIENRGGNAFRSLALPRAVLKMRQGFGRLVRSTSDRGAVVVLDSRILDKWYGRAFISALPNARRLVAPWPRIIDELRAFYDDMSPTSHGLDRRRAGGLPSSTGPSTDDPNT